MPEATQLGLIEGGENFAEPLAVGDVLEIIAMPTYKNVAKGEVVEIPTKDGLRGTFSKAVIGSLRSTTPKSVGDILTKALEQGETLTVYVVENKANTGRIGMSLSLFKPKKA